MSQESPYGTPGARRRKSAPGGESQDPELAELAAAVKAAYVRERTVLQTLSAGTESRYRPPKRYDGLPEVTDDDGNVIEKAVPSAWYKLARFFRDNQLEPDEFVRAVFSDRAFDTRPPEPSQLRSARAWASWEAYLASNRACLQAEFVTQKAIARGKVSYHQTYSGLDYEGSHIYVVLDPDLALSPLFRYCLAATLGGVRLERAAKRFEAAACLQYSRYPKVYREVWGEFIPKGFAGLSRLVCSRLRGE